MTNIGQTVKTGNKTSFWWSIVLVLTGLAIAYWGMYSPIIETPSVTSVGSWSWAHSLPLLAFWGVLALLIKLNAKEAAKTLQWVLAVVVCMLLFGFPTLSRLKGSFSPDCVAGHPCVLSQNDDGSSGVVDVPKGKVACFEPWMWSHLDELGLTISYQAAGASERPFPCSLKEVYGGSCTVTYDHFSFKPGHPVPLPKYWFVASGSRQC
ncbi:MAG: hypothetical protein KGH79_04380 [Patescibacteria group bacterium]|nr:hypothetical protein [Patescibacteria group bacterium]